MLNIWKKTNGFTLFASLDIQNFSRWKWRLGTLCVGNDIKKREEEGVFWEYESLVEIWFTDVERTGDKTGKRWGHTVEDLQC